jgi:hypothetical protein
MKKATLILLVTLLFVTGYSQNPLNGISGRFTPVIKKEKLNNATFLSDIMPEFGRYFSLPYNDRIMFDNKRIILYPQNYFYPQENFNNIIDYVYVEIITVYNGEALTAIGSNEVLTMEQKDIISKSDLGTDINIKIKFRFKDQISENRKSVSDIKEGKYVVTVVPETEALYPGGFKQITEYLTENILNNFSKKYASEKIQQAIVRFTVNEEGQIVDALIYKTSTDLKIDELLLEATKSMTKWTPAENSKGNKVSQVFNIPLGGGGGC